METTPKAVEDVRAGDTIVEWDVYYQVTRVEECGGYRTFQYFSQRFQKVRTLTYRPGRKVAVLKKFL